MTSYDYYLLGFATARQGTSLELQSAPASTVDLLSWVAGIDAGSKEHAPIRSPRRLDEYLSEMLGTDTLSLNRSEVQRVVDFIDFYANQLPKGPVTEKMKAFLGR